MKILLVIMGGGAETRVWPESRDSLPKQFNPHPPDDALTCGARTAIQLT
jgi:mannose-1-phosphate guanylyltransferase